VVVQFGNLLSGGQRIQQEARPGIDNWSLFSTLIEKSRLSLRPDRLAFEPLRDDETVVNLISRTTTAQGLQVTYRLDHSKHLTGRKVTDEGIRRVKLEKNKFHGEWNYAIHPSTQSNGCRLSLLTLLIRRCESLGLTRLTASCLPEPDHSPVVALEAKGESADRNADGVLIAR
jgi:hypothetical protein